MGRRALAPRAGAAASARSIARRAAARAAFAGWPASVCLALAALASPAAAQRPWAWRPDERVLITTFDDVGAVATDLRRVFAATPNGIEVYDFAAGRWDPPITAEDGYPAGERPTALAHDAFGGRLWLGTAAGTLYAYLPAFGRWERYGPVGGGGIVRVVVGGRSGDGAVFVATRGGWHRLRRGAAFFEPVSPARLPPALAGAADSPERRLRRADPAFGAVRNTVTMDEHLRRWPIADVAPAHLPGRHWIATRGGNLFLYDGRRADAEPMRYGLPSRGVSALAIDHDGVWFGGDGRGARRGVAFADRGLQHWRRFEAGLDDAPGGEVRAIAASAGAVWFAASDGLFRYDRERDRWRRLTERDGLPSASTTALAAVEGGLWVGTGRGLVFVTDDGEVARETLLPGRRIDALSAAPDALWIAGEFGLRRLARGGAPGARRTVRGALEPAGGEPRAVDPPAGSDGRFVDVCVGPGALWAITADALFRFDGTRWEGPMREPATGGIGRLRALAVSGERLWIAGDGGVAARDARSRLWTFFRVGRDIPEGPVRAVVPAGDRVWLATPGGALRLEWRR